MDYSLYRPMTDTDFDSLLKFLKRSTGLFEKDLKLDIAKSIGEVEGDTLIMRSRAAFSISQLNRPKTRALPEEFSNGVLRYLVDKFGERETNFIVKHVTKNVPAGSHPELALSPDDESGPLMGTLGSLESIANLSHDFIKNCTNENGKFVLFSMSEHNRFKLSAMEVTCNPQNIETMIPNFTTRHYSEKSKQVQIVTGFIAVASRFVYAFGKTRGIRNYRLSKLIHQPRERKIAEFGGEEFLRYDLFGLRLGGYEDWSNPNCHRIYAYQIKRGNRYDKAVDLIGKTSTAGEEIFNELDIKDTNAKRIKEMLMRPSTLPGNLDTEYSDATLSKPQL